jgi:hypothetical protein
MKAFKRGLGLGLRPEHGGALGRDGLAALRALELAGPPGGCGVRGLRDRRHLGSIHRATPRNYLKVRRRPEGSSQPPHKLPAELKRLWHGYRPRTDREWTSTGQKHDASTEGA